MQPLRKLVNEMGVQHSTQTRTVMRTPHGTAHARGAGRGRPARHSHWTCNGSASAQGPHRRHLAVLHKVGLAAIAGVQRRGLVCRPAAAAAAAAVAAATLRAVPPRQQRDALYDGNAVRPHAVQLGAVVGHEPDGPHRQVPQNVRRNAVLSQVHLRQRGTARGRLGQLVLAHTRMAGRTGLCCCRRRRGLVCPRVGLGAGRGSGSTTTPAS